jgi:hypothetical protein
MTLIVACSRAWLTLNCLFRAILTSWKGTVKILKIEYTANWKGKNSRFTIKKRATGQKKSSSKRVSIITTPFFIKASGESTESFSSP